MFFSRLCAITLIAMLSAFAAFAQSKSKPSDKFRQLTDEELPTPNEQRTASGAPGRGYWQNRADYVIDVEIDETTNRLTGKETVTYKNLSPDTLTYVWVQVDQNIFAKDSIANKTQTAPEFRNNTLNQVGNIVANDYDGKVSITRVVDARNNPLRYIVNDTMMRIDLPAPLAPGQNFVFSIDWNFIIPEARRVGARMGWEVFPDGNYIYGIAQWFPRMAAYHDTYGWQHKQFLGAGEFTLEFGDYTVRITAPNDHVLVSTGLLQNPNEVLTPTQRQRLKQAETAKAPVMIVTPEEARAAEKGKPTGKKTWVYKAENVRDFAFSSSRKYIWDAMGHNVGGNRVMAMSVYPNEGNPLWQQYSTHAIIHCLNVYSRYSFDYPYPTAISANAAISGGMEYPMISFNAPYRPDADGTYSAGTKYGLISVIIHEVGHNYFPMIVNSDERQWTWMDEGINSFLQYLAEQEWEKNYPSWRGEPQNIVEYMLSENQVPIMTNSDSALQFGNNAYGKPATALNVLRETVMGRELFDHAFKTYSQRWKFKRPQPADFFRTMEDASAVDLDWFWRGWFYSTDHVDISMENVRLFQIDTRNPEVEKGIQRQRRDSRPVTLSQQRNAPLPKRVDEYPSLKDFYNEYDPLNVTEQDRAAYQQFLSTLNDRERQLLQGNFYFYVVDLKNIGGIPMPLIFKVEYVDGTSEEIRVPVEIWRYNNFNVSKLIVARKEAKSIILDPNLETADGDLSNNFFPRRTVPTRFQVFKGGQGQGGGNNPMRQAQQQRQTAATPTATPSATTGAASLTGRWNINVEAPGQLLPLTLVLTQNGNALTGSVEGGQGATPITNGVITTNGFSFQTTITFGGQSLVITIEGKQNGNSISGTATAPQGSAPFTGTKAQ